MEHGLQSSSLLDMDGDLPALPKAKRDPSCFLSVFPFISGIIWGQRAA